MEIIRTDTYRKSLKRLRKPGATERDIVDMENAAASNPTAGDVIRDTGGLRKMRFTYGGHGKSSGGRTIYFVLVANDRLFLLVAYAKADQLDLTAEQKKTLKALASELRGEGGHD